MCRTRKAGKGRKGCQGNITAIFIGRPLKVLLGRRYLNKGWKSRHGDISGNPGRKITDVRWCCGI